MEPMLLEDHRYGDVPRSVSNLLTFFERNKLTPDKNDLIVGLLHILMVESGFVHKACTDLVEDCDFNYKRLLRHSQSLPANWKLHNSYRTDFVLKSAPHLVSNLICTPVADDLLVNCVIKDVDTFSVLLDPLTYFTSSTVQLGSFAFQSLDHLARTFKNRIAFPAKIAVVAATGGICGCFQDLPHDLLVRIMRYLRIQDVMSLARTCRAACQSAQEPILWVKLLDADFRKKNICKTYEELKFLYEIKYARELNRILLNRPPN